MKKQVYAAALLSAAVLLSGCGNKISDDDYPKDATTVSKTEAAPADESAAPADAPAEETTTTTAATTAAPETTTTTTTTAKKVDPSEYMATTSEWVGSVVIADRYNGDKIRAFMPFYSTDYIGESFSETVNQCKDLVGDDINVYCMSIPLAAPFYLPEELSFDFADQKESLKYVYNALDDDVIPVNVFDTLADHASEYIYARTDHHWQPLGGYYAESKFAEVADVPHPDISEYEECHIDNYTGSMGYYSGGCQQLYDHPDTYYYHKPPVEYSVKDYDSFFTESVPSELFYEWVQGDACYCCILGTDDKITEIDTDVDNGRVLVLIKDSYGNALVPYLTTGFEKIYVCDFRYSDIYISDFAEEVGATYILYGLSISSCFEPSQIEAMNKML